MPGSNLLEIEHLGHTTNGPWRSNKAAGSPVSHFATWGTQLVRGTACERRVCARRRTWRQRTRTGPDYTCVPGGQKKRVATGTPVRPKSKNAAYGTHRQTFPLQPVDVRAIAGRAEAMLRNATKPHGGTCLAFLRLGFGVSKIARFGAVVNTLSS